MRECGQNAAYQWSGVRVVLVFYLKGASILILDISSIQYLVTGLVRAKKNQVQGPRHTTPLCVCLSSEAIARVICALALSRLFVLSVRGSRISHPN